MSGGVGSFTSTSGKNARSFHSNLLDLEEEIAETRKELNFCRKEVQILNHDCRAAHGSRGSEVRCSCVLFIVVVYYEQDRRRKGTKGVTKLCAASKKSK